MININLQKKIDDSKRILDNLFNDRNYHRKQPFVCPLYSGGKDSVCATHLAHQHIDVHQVLHVRTKTGYYSELHSDRAIALAKAYGWNIVEESSTITYEMLVLKYGFANPSYHGIFYGYLKGKAIDELIKKARTSSGKKCILMPTGIRRSESKKRREAPEYKQASKIEYWVNTIVHWSLEDIFEYMKHYDLIANIGESGECLCGTMSRPDERENIANKCPEQEVYWKYLESIVKLRRELMLMEVKLGTRDTKTVFPEEFLTWGNKKGNSQDASVDSDGVSICSVCDKDFNSNGSVGLDPDEFLLSYKNRVDEINYYLSNPESNRQQELRNITDEIFNGMRTSIDSSKN